MNCYCTSCGECGLALKDDIVAGLIIVGLLILLSSPMWWGFWRKQK